MNNSNSEESKIRKNRDDECEDDKELSENRGTVETCTKDESIVSPAKRKSQPIEKEETKRKRNTKCIETEDCDKLTAQTNVEETFSIVEIHEMEDNVIKDSFQIDETSIKVIVTEPADETESAEHAISSCSEMSKNLTVKEIIDDFFSTDESDIVKEFKSLDEREPKKMPSSPMEKTKSLVEEKSKCTDEEARDSSLPQDAVPIDAFQKNSEQHMLRTIKFSDKIIEFIERDKIEESEFNNGKDFQTANEPGPQLITIERENISDESIVSKSDLSKKQISKSDNSFNTDRAVNSADLKSKEDKSVTKDESFSKSKMFESIRVKMDNSNKQSRIMDFPIENIETGEKELSSKLKEVEGTCQNYENFLHDSQTSPAKRKSDLIAEDEIKRRRSIYGLERECDDRNLIGSSDETSETSDDFTKYTECSTGIEIADYMKEEAREHGVLYEAHESTTEEASEQSESNDSIGSTSQICTPLTESEKLTQFEGLAARVTLTDKSVSQNKSLHSSGVPTQSESSLVKETSSENAVSYTDTPNSLNRGNLEIFNKEQNTFRTTENEADSNRNIETENSKNLSGDSENNLLEFRIEINSSLKISCNAPSDGSQSSDIKPGDSNISKSCHKTSSREVQSHQEPFPNRESCSRLFPRAYSRRTRKFRLHPIYIEPESKYIPIEYYENDPEFVESQKQILESFEKRSTLRQQLPSEPIGGPISDFINKEYLYEMFSGLDDRKFTMAENFALKHAMDYIYSNPRELQNPSELNRVLKEIILKYFLIALQIIEEEENLGNYVTESPSLTNEESRDTVADDNESTSPKSLPDDENSFPKSLQDDENTSPKSLSPDDENFPNFLPPDHEPVSPLVSPDNTVDKTSEINFPIFREYPGLAEEPAKVKKDARYQKKFYKQKPVKLPINWNVGNSSTEPDENIDSEDKLQKSENNARNLPDEKPEHKKLEVDDQLLLSKNEEKKCHANEGEESHESEKPEILQSADGYKMSSFMEESPTSPTGSSTSDKSDSPEKNSPPDTFSN